MLHEGIINMKTKGDQLDAIAQQAIASYRSMTDWLTALPDKDYEDYLKLPFAARLAVFRGLGFGAAQYQRVDLVSAGSTANRGDQLAFSGI